MNRFVRGYRLKKQRIIMLVDISVKERYAYNIINGDDFLHHDLTALVIGDCSWSWKQDDS